MADYNVEIDGSNTLQQIELAIQGEEATGSEFLRSSVSYHENVIANLATFNDLPPGLIRSSRPPITSLITYTVIAFMP